MPNTKMVRDLCHDIINILAGIYGHLQNMQLSDITPGTSRESYQTALECCERLYDRISETREELHASYRRSYATYKGDPALIDRKGHEIHLKSPVELPVPDIGDHWDQPVIGVVISTTRGDGMITVRDTADNCWDIEADRVDLITEALSH